MSDVIDISADIDPASIQIELCELCGCVFVDLEEVIYLRAADLVAQWERDDPRDAWRHTGEQPPRAVKPAGRREATLHTPQSTIDAFWHVVRLADPKRLAAWLDDHPNDEIFLLNLLESK
jgi:hypothetical protein